MAAACLSGNWKSRHWWSGWLPDPSACQPVGTALWYESTGEVHNEKPGILECQTCFMDSAALIWGYIMTIMHLTDLKMAVHFPILFFLSFMAISHQKYKYQCFQITSKNTTLQRQTVWVIPRFEFQSVCVCVYVPVYICVREILLCLMIDIRLHKFYFQIKGMLMNFCFTEPTEMTHGG